MKRKAEDFPPLKNDLILRVLNKEKVERTPVWIMRQAGRYLPEFRAVREQHDFFEVCRDPELASLVTIQPIDRYEGLLDAAIIFSDILVVPQAMGMRVDMLPGTGPHFPNPLREPADLSKLKETVNVDQSLSYVYDAIALTRFKLNGRVPLFGFAGAPWTLMAYMIEGGGSKTFSRAKKWLFKYPNAAHQLLQKITLVVIDFLVGQAKAGAQLLQVFESWAGELSHAEFDQFSLPYLKQIAHSCKARFAELGLKIPMTVFAKGAHYAVEQLSLLEYDAMSLDWTMDPAAVRKITKQKVTLQGNADPGLLYGDDEIIQSQVRKMLGAFGPKQHIANLGHGMQPDHEPKKLRVYLEAIKSISTELNK